MIVGLDIGTSKVVALVGEIGADGRERHGQATDHLLSGKGCHSSHRPCAVPMADDLSTPALSADDAKRMGLAACFSLGFG